MIFYFQNATPGSSESIKIDEEKLDRYVGSIIAAAASSLQDVVIRVSSSTRQSEKDSDNGVASSLNVCGILTLSYSEVTPSESLTAVCEPEGGTPVHAPIQEGKKYEKYEAQFLGPHISELELMIPVKKVITAV